MEKTSNNGKNKDSASPGNGFNYPRQLFDFICDIKDGLAILLSQLISKLIRFK